MSDTMTDLFRDVLNSKTALEADRAAVQLLKDQLASKVSAINTGLEARIRALQDQAAVQTKAASAEVDARVAALAPQEALHQNRLAELTKHLS